MTIALIAAGTIALLLIVALALRGSSKAKYSARPVLSRPEQVFYYQLKKALPDYEILAQVPFGRFLTTKGGSKSERNSKWYSARQKIADYLVCNKDMSIAAAVELDDKSHNKEKDHNRDQILREAGIPTLRWNVKQLPTENEIKIRLQETLRA